MLLGVAEPGGRLPCVFPRDEADLPAFDRDATTVTYDRWFGQRLLDRDGVRAAYPLGFGLGYTTFAMSGVQASSGSDGLEVTARVRNTGSRAGGHVVQLYASRPAEGFAGIERVLLDFLRVEVAAGDSVVVRFLVPLRRLSRWCRPGEWAVEGGTYAIEVGAHAGDPAAATATVTL